jgi:hypothetical protein
MKLPRMLMVGKDSGCDSMDVLGHQKEGPDTLLRLNRVFDRFSHIQATIDRFQDNGVE